MPDDGESMGSVFLEGLHSCQAMLDFRPLVHPALQRYVSKPCFIGYLNLSCN